MKKTRIVLAFVLVLSMVLCATVPTFAETLSNAADVTADFDYIAFELQTVNSSDTPTMFFDKGETVTLNIALFGILGSVKTQLTTPKVRISIISDDGTQKLATVSMTNGIATYTFTAMDMAGWQRICLRALDSSGNDLTDEVIVEYSGGITVDKDTVTASLSKPDDFESWWAQVIKEELDTCPPEVISVEQIDDGTYLAYRVYVTAPTLRDSEHQFLKSGDTYVSFNLSFPKEATAGSCFIRANFQGYNMGVGGYWGGSANTILLNVNAHSTTLHETHTYDEISDWEKGTSGKYGWDATRTADRDTHYFKYMILRDLQAIRFAQLCFGPEGYNKTVDGVDFSQFKGIWDGENVRTMGTSQGGFQATAMAALCPDVTYCETSMTWLCDVAGGYVNDRVISSFRPVRAQNIDGRYGLDYFDTVYFATMIDCPYTITVAGTGDTVSPTSGILALYNTLNVPQKTIKFTQGRGHMTSNAIWQYHTYFGDASESYSGEGGCSVTPEGFAVRIEDYTGLRSIFSFNSKYNSYYGQKGLTLSEYGALMMSSANFEALCGSDDMAMYELGIAGTSTKVKYIPVHKIVDDEQVGYNRYLSVENGIYTYCVTLTDIPEINYKDDVYICAYAKWTDTNGNETLEFAHYTDTLGQEARSLYDITAAAYKMGVVNANIAPDFDTVIWPVLEKGAVAYNDFTYFDVPLYNYSWYTSPELTTPAENENASLDYVPGEDEPTESGILWSLIEYGGEYVAAYRLADGEQPTTLPRLDINGYTFQPFHPSFNSSLIEYTSLKTSSPTLPESVSAKVKTLIVDGGITGAGACSLSDLASVETVIVSSDFAVLEAGTFAENSSMNTLFVAGTEAEEDTLDLSSMSISSGESLFSAGSSFINIKLPADVELSGSGVFAGCSALERVWVDGSETPLTGIIDLSGAAALTIADMSFDNVVKINTIILPDNTSLASGVALEDALQNAGQDNPYSILINLNLVLTVGSTAEQSVNSLPFSLDLENLKIGINGVAVEAIKDLEIDGSTIF